MTAPELVVERPAPEERELALGVPGGRGPIALHLLVKNGESVVGRLVDCVGPHVSEVVAVLNDFLGEIATINEIWARRMRDEFGDKEGNIRRSKATFADMLRVWADASNDFLDEREAAEEEEGGDDDGDEDDPDGDQEGADAASQVVDAEFTVE